MIFREPDYGSDFDVEGQNGFGYCGLDGDSRLHEYVLDLNLLVKPPPHGRLFRRCGSRKRIPMPQPGMETFGRLRHAI
jgi:hypothetical protein